MNTSPEEIDDTDLIGTVSFKFTQSPSYTAAASLKLNEMIFPNGMCIYYELQMDPISMYFCNHAGFTKYLINYDKLTKLLCEA